MLPQQILRFDAFKQEPWNKIEKETDLLINGDSLTESVTIQKAAALCRS